MAPSRTFSAFTMAILTTASVSLLPTPARAQGDEILPGVYRLHGINASLPDDDLEPLKEIIGDARVVGLGERTHTSGGFSRLKYRVFRYLVEEMGFRAFAFESPWDYADSVTRYVESCEGTPEDALLGLFGVWRNESVRDLVKWMCVWNFRHPDDPVTFIGFDEQQPERDYPALVDLLDRFGLPERDPRRRGLESCSKSREDGPITPDDFRECTKRLTQLSRYLDRREAVLARRTSAREVELARIRLVGLHAWQEQSFYRSRDSERGSEARDAAMAEIFLRKWNLDLAGAKTAIWAANFHISEDLSPSLGLTTMGVHLADALGDDYMTFALLGYVIEIDWPGVGCGPIPAPAAPDAVEVLLHDLGEPWLLVDLALPGTDAPFFEEGRQYQLMGGYAIPRDQYDAMLFLDRSRKMVPTYRPPCD